MFLFNAAVRVFPLVGLKIIKNITTNEFVGMHSAKTLIQGQSMSVYILPALQDNFMYLIVDEKSKEAAVVDPVDSAVVTSAIEENQVNLTKILTTHHHWDHAGGNEDMCKKFRDIQVFGGDNRIQAINKIVAHGDHLSVGNLKVQCLSTPCHTTGHICYLVTGEDDDPPSVFTGDTLFIGGCGRFFEGTAEQMYKSLGGILGSLPDQTRVYCGHEYTCQNLQFGLTVEPTNENIIKKLEWAIAQRQTQTPTVPSTIGDEKKTNPFMRLDEPSVMKYTATSNPIETMGSLRKEKDNFK